MDLSRSDHRSLRTAQDGRPSPGTTRALERLTQAAIVVHLLVVTAGCNVGVDTDEAAGSPSADATGGEPGPQFVTSLVSSPAAPAPARTDAVAPPPVGSLEAISVASPSHRTDAPDPASSSATTADTGWILQLKTNTAVLRPNAAGCLVATSTTLTTGKQVTALAGDGRYYVIDESGGCLPAASVTVLSKPATLPAGRPAEIAYNTYRYTYGADGCPVQGAALGEQTTVEGIARSYDLNYHGYVVIDRALSLAPVRHVNADGWVYPWHSSVQLLKQVSGGYVIGGAVLIGPNTLLTARHMKVDASWCYSREPNTGTAWYGGQAVCNNIVGPAEESPDGVDAALVTLIRPEVEPFAVLRATSLAPGEAFFSSKWSNLHQNAMADSAVEEVDNDNAFCQRWPASTSYLSEDPILQGGDSGGPAWVGNALVGLVHGEKCYKGIEKIVWQQSGEPAAHVLVHVPGIMGFVTSGL